MNDDKSWAQAQHSLIDPLVEPDPSEDTGLNSHFRSTFAPQPEVHTPPDSAGVIPAPSTPHKHHTGGSTSTNPFRRSHGSPAANSPSSAQHGPKTPMRSTDYPSPPNSASPRHGHFASSYRSEAFRSLNEGRPRRSSQPSTSKPPFQGNSPSSGLARSGSLRERYPGDTSHRPLDTIKRESKVAHRAPHLRKKNFYGADRIDRLDNTGFSYHHEGPYDAANMNRNLDWKYSPVAAVADSNEEALRATPRENIIDAITRHRPIEGVAIVPPGVPDRFGRVLDYNEGADLMREPGADYKRWPGVEYRPDDLKGKGEPSYTIEKALKDHNVSGNDIEMQTRRRNHSVGASQDPAGFPSQTIDAGTGLSRSNTTGRSIGNSLKKRFSIRRKKAETSA